MSERDEVYRALDAIIKEIDAYKAAWNDEGKRDENSEGKADQLAPDSYGDDEEHQYDQAGVSAKEILSNVFYDGMHFLAAYELPPEARGLRDLANLAGDAELTEDMAEHVINQLRSIHRRLRPDSEESS
jgi:hypothetical protein